MKKYLASILVVFLLGQSLIADSPGEKYSIHLLQPRAVDGDTIAADLEVRYTVPEIELPLGITVPEESRSVVLRNQRIRLKGINAPELITAQGRDVRDVVHRVISGTKLELRYIPGSKAGKDKYGRWEGDVLIGSDSLSKWLLQSEYAEPDER